MTNVISKWLDKKFKIKKIDIKLGQRVVIIGRPGTGKSTFLRWLLKDVKSIVVYDSKYDPEEWPKQKDYSIVGRASELYLHARVILQCPMAWLTTSENWDSENHPWSIALEHPMRRGNTIAVFDEALHTWPVRDSHPGTHRLVQQGRSFGVTTIVGSQLANNIDTRLLRMTNHIFVLGPCRHATELESIFRATQINIHPLTKMRKHEIAWWSEERDEWIVFKADWFKTKNLLKARKINIPGEPGPLWPRLLIFLAIGIGVGIFFKIGLLLSGLYLLTLSSLAIYSFRRRYRWEIEVESKEWVPRVIQEEAPVDAAPRKRESKDFRVL